MSSSSGRVMMSPRGDKSADQEASVKKSEESRLKWL
jgi:hypothetical protein